MGLLDSLFNSDTYGGQQGGLLGLLKSIQDQNAVQPNGQGFPQQGDSFASRFNALPNAPQPANPSGRSFDAAQFNPQTYAPNQAQPIGVGNVQMPRIGSADQFASSQPAQGTPQAQPQIPPQVANANAQAPAAPPDRSPLPTFLSNQGGLGAGVRGFLNNAQTGPIGALLGGIGSAMGMQNPAQQNQAAQYHATRQALIGNGLDETQASRIAMLSVMNPEAAKTVLPELLTNKEKYGVVSENPIEGKKYGFINEREQTINGKPLGAGGGSGEGPGMLAPGVKFDSSLNGDAYLNQFSPEVQAATKAWLKGDVLPSGNPRQNGIANIAKTIGQKYAADMGIPASDALYAEKRKYRTELGTNSPNSVGGQAKAFNQGIDHLTNLAGTLEKLDNSNGLGIPWLAQGANAVRQGVSNDQSALADEAKSLGQTVAGEVGKLFSGSSGGGVHERELTRDRFDTVKSKPQLAAALRATIETMDGGLRALEVNRDRVLGPNSGVEFVDAKTKENIAKIQGVIDRLEGKSSAAPNAALPSGWSVKVR